MDSGWGEKSVVVANYLFIVITRQKATIISDLKLSVLIFFGAFLRPLINAVLPEFSVLGFRRQSTVFI